MKRFCMALSLILLTLLLVSCQIPTPIMSVDTAAPSSDFNLVFEFGIGHAPNKNVLDTFQGTFTKDMVLDPPITVKLRLSDEQLDQIRNKMDEINFWDYPDVLEYEPPADGVTGIASPYMSYYFKAMRGAAVKEVNWEDEYVDQSVRATGLRELAMFIQNIIDSSPEYKALPEPRGGYI